MAKSFSIKKNQKIFMTAEDVEPMPAASAVVVEVEDKKGKKSKKSKKSKKEVVPPVVQPPPVQARKLGSTSTGMRIKKNFKSTVVDSY
jgi:hypothetical protein